jgi:hypothetical protein
MRKIMSGFIINFPKHNEVKKLMQAKKINSEDYSDEMLTSIEQAIFAVRYTHGLFEPRRFNAVITLLEHDWLPSDIPFLLPEPFINNIAN